MPALDTNRIGIAGGDEVGNLIDGVHVLAVIVHDDVKLGARVLGREFRPGWPTPSSPPSIESHRTA